MDKENFNMPKTDERLNTVENKLSFWKGFASGVACTIGTLFGLVAAVYYVIEIYKSTGG